MEFLTTVDSYEHIRVCRVCLVMNVKMYDLRCYPLETYFEAVIGIPVMSTLDLPPYLCFQCMSLVKKFSMFRDQCLQGQATLYGILRQTGKFTERDILAVDRPGLLLSSNLSICHITDQIELISADEVQQVKEEPDIVQDDSKLIDIQVTVDVKEEADLNFPGADLDFPEADCHQSSDDEPLSVHKTGKADKKKGKKRGRKKKKVEALDACQSEEAGLEAPEQPARPEGLPRKVGRPKKNEVRDTTLKTKKNGAVDYEDINMHDYVNIISLTLEEQLEEVSKRQESSNYRNAPYQCSLCYKGFINTSAWEHHLRKHDPSAGAAQCAVCRFRFPSQRALQKHAVNHEKKYVCKACDYVSKTVTQAKQHQRWHKGVTYTCEYCDEVSTKWTSYLSHVRMKHPSQHICPVCGYSFVSRLGLAMHRTMMHKQEVNAASSEAESGPYCEPCDVKFVSAEAYNRHMVTSTKHSEGNNFSKGCRVCGARFSSPEELRLHQRAEHARARPRSCAKKDTRGKWPQDCTHCAESIPGARELWAHYRRAHPDLPYPIQKDYVCDVCGKAFRGNAFLKYHARTHSTERAYKCPTCDKAFFNRTNLNMHLRTHSAARPYTCHVCCKGFKNKSALDRHYRCHTGVKPYECEVCGKAFGQSNSRKLHVRTVHLKQPAPYRAKQHKPKQEALTEQRAFVY